MTIPVSVPASALPVSDDQNALAEAIVSALGQLMQYGSSGSSVTTPPIYVPDPPVNPVGQRAVSILTANQQLFFRQMALAVVKNIGFNFVDFYNPSLVDGAATFTLPHTPIPSSVTVWRGPSHALAVDLNRDLAANQITLWTPFSVATESLFVSYRY